jgi:hypothetical protein
LVILILAVVSGIHVNVSKSEKMTNVSGPLQRNTILSHIPGGTTLLEDKVMEMAARDMPQYEPYNPGMTTTQGGYEYMKYQLSNPNTDEANAVLAQEMYAQ